MVNWQSNIKKRFGSGYDIERPHPNINDNMINWKSTLAKRFQHPQDLEVNIGDLKQGMVNWNKRFGTSFGTNGDLEDKHNMMPENINKRFHEVLINEPFGRADLL